MAQKPGGPCSPGSVSKRIKRRSLSPATVHHGHLDCPAVRAGSGEASRASVEGQQPCSSLGTERATRRLARYDIGRLLPGVSGRPDQAGCCKEGQARKRPGSSGQFGASFQAGKSHWPANGCLRSTIRTFERLLRPCANPRWCGPIARHQERGRALLASGLLAEQVLRRRLGERVDADDVVRELQAAESLLKSAKGGSDRPEPNPLTLQ